MNKEYYLKLTLCVYRVTKCFPQNEPLKNQIRKKANEILAGLILSNPAPSFSGEKKLLKDFEIIDNYFEIAKNQNWLDSQNFLFLEKEYDRIRDRFNQNRSRVGSATSDTITTSDTTKSDRIDILLPRHRKILEILREKGKARIKEFGVIFSDVTLRTLHRDFEFLIQQKIIKKQGEKNDIFYKIWN